MIKNLYNNEQYGIDSTSRTCDCGNQEWKMEGKNFHGCKHIRKIREWIKRND